VKKLIALLAAIGAVVFFWRKKHQDDTSSWDSDTASSWGDTASDAAKDAADTTEDAAKDAADAVGDTAHSAADAVDDATS
jgi:hypothetical protein